MKFLILYHAIASLKVQTPDSVPVDCIHLGSQLDSLVLPEAEPLPVPPIV